MHGPLLQLGTKKRSTTSGGSPSRAGMGGVFRCRVRGGGRGGRELSPKNDKRRCWVCRGRDDRKRLENGYSHAVSSFFLNSLGSLEVLLGSTTARSTREGCLLPSARLHELLRRMKNKPSQWPERAARAKTPRLRLFPFASHVHSSAFSVHPETTDKCRTPIQLAAAGKYRQHKLYPKKRAPVI